MWLEFDPHPLEDLRFWIDTDRRKALKIAGLIEDILKTHCTGLGKPEPLRFELKGCWSRRIDQEHRLVCEIEKAAVVILGCRCHYE